MKKLIVVVIVVLAGTASAQQPAPAASNAARQCCAEALNADPEFARSVVTTYDKQADQRAIDMHNAHAAQIAENQRHVIYAYAAMWVFAALFVVFMWRRQQALKAELAALRRELDAAIKEDK